jgi:hypothetical protein
MSKSKTMLAIQNNAEWCLRIWKCHGLRTFQEENLWFCPDKVPDFYPNVVTMQQGEADIIRDITKVHAQCASQGFSVKDSFAEVDLGKLELHRLFDGNWLYLSPENKKSAVTDLDWAPVLSDAELSVWEAQWDGREEGRESIFLPALLTDPSVEFWAGRSEGEIKAGFISNVTGPVVGISNTFGLYEECVTHAACQFSNFGIVTYEDIGSVPEATSTGFEVIGDLTVWVTSCRSAFDTLRASTAVTLNSALQPISDYANLTGNVIQARHF